MNVVLSEHLALLATAPDGIQNLRSLILELGVRGRLVPQDSNDEPASELLRRIAQERARLDAKGTSKRLKLVSPVGDDEKPFSLPNGWVSTRIGTIAEISGGKRLPSGHTYSGERTPFVYIQVTNMKEGTILSKELKYLSSDTRNLISRYTISKDDLYVTIAGTIGDVGIVPAEFDGMNLTENAAKLSFSYIDRYCLRALLSAPYVKKQFLAKANQQAQPKLALRNIADTVVALPPIAELHRIVAKIDELMALCDRLEAEQSNADAAQAKLVETLLGTLTQSTDAANLASNWQRVAANFGSFFATESSVDVLKQTILQLGVSGRLTNVTSFESLKLGELLIDADYGTSQKSDSERINGACPVLRIPNVVQEKLDLADLKFSVLDEKELQKVLLNDGDILVVRTNGSAELVGRCAVVKDLPERVAFASYMIRLRFDPSRVDPEFAQRTLRNHRLQNRMIDFARTTAGQYNVSIGRLRELEMQIPSLVEQHRIVAKVDELMVFCDSLKNMLVKSRNHQEQLTSTLIESALRAA